ncbi:hypothetical protein SNEBB_001951 [Seison nebaliae]|nr:hypothetical protein SNEBB_001951 [Seison nebaliae]
MTQGVVYRILVAIFSACNIVLGCIILSFNIAHAVGRIHKDDDRIGISYFYHNKNSVLTEICRAAILLGAGCYLLYCTAKKKYHYFPIVIALSVVQFAFMITEIISRLVQTKRLSKLLSVRSSSYYYLNNDTEYQWIRKIEENHSCCGYEPLIGVDHLFCSDKNAKETCNKWIDAHEVAQQKEKVDIFIIVTIVISGLNIIIGSIGFAYERKQIKAVERERILIRQQLKDKKRDTRQTKPEIRQGHR